MKRQNDWYTGIDYFMNSKEKEIQVKRKVIKNQTELCIHDQVSLIFVKSGNGVIEINGINYHLKRGSFLCLYMHHFYMFKSVEEPLDIVKIDFYIGNFMFMCFESHPINANATLVYDTCPHVFLKGKELSKIEERLDELLLEVSQKRFSSLNMRIYITLELHAYFCRYAFENIDKGLSNPIEWQIIQKIILSAQKDISLEELAKEANLSEYHLNQKIKKACGFTYYQLSKFGKIINACALLHFPELSMDYISDILNFSSKNSFYRFFKQHTNMTPKDYQLKCILKDEDMINGYSHKGILFLQYMHLNFMKDISVNSLANEFYIKDYSVELIFKNIFKSSFKDIISQIRISYACSFLTSTDKSITEISELCNFESISTFQRAFKKYMGQSPSQYKKYMQEFDNKTLNYD